MTDNSVSAYQLANLRIMAFAAFEGWQRRGYEGEYVPLNFHERTEFANSLVKWALNNEGIGQ